MIRFFFTHPAGTFIKDLICVAILMYIAYLVGQNSILALIAESV